MNAQAPTTIRVYRALSPKSLAALREPLARQVFRVSKYDEEHGRRSFVVNADGSWVYDNTLRRWELGQGKMLLREEQDAREEAQKHIEYLQEIISKFPRLHAAFAEAPLLPQGLRFDRAERLIVLKNDTTEAASNPLWHWRVHYLLKFRPSGTEDYVPVEGGRCHIDLAPSGMILGAGSGILPFQPNPSSSKRFTVLDLRKQEASKDSLSKPTEAPILAKGVNVVPLEQTTDSTSLEKVDVFYAYNGDSGCYAAYCAAIGGEGGKVAVCEEGFFSANADTSEELLPVEPPKDVPPSHIHVPLSYDISVPTKPRVIQCNSTGQLSGVLLFSSSLPIPGGIDSYVANFRDTILSFWEHPLVAPEGLPQFKVTSDRSTTFPVYGLGDLFLLAGSGLNEVVFAINNPIAPVSAVDLVGHPLVDRICLIDVGTPLISAVNVFNQPSTGAMVMANNGSEAAHEFGHLCGLVDRYAEVLIISGSVPNRQFDQSLNPTLPLPFTSINPVIPPLERQTIPIAKFPSSEPEYNYLSNLMSKSLPWFLNDAPVAGSHFTPSFFFDMKQSLTRHQRQIVYGNQYETPIFRVDIFEMKRSIIDRFDSHNPRSFLPRRDPSYIAPPRSSSRKFDGIEFVATPPTNFMPQPNRRIANSTNLRAAVTFEHINLYHRHSPLSNKTQNEQPFINEQQWIKIWSNSDALDYGLRQISPKAVPPPPQLLVRELLPLMAAGACTVYYHPGWRKGFSGNANLWSDRFNLAPMVATHFFNFQWFTP